MKKRLVWMLVPALLLAAVGCEKKESADQGAAPAAPAEAPTDLVDDPTPVIEGKISAKQRGEMVGFARYLPRETEYLISVHNGSDATRRVMASKIWKTFATMAGMPMGIDGEEIAEEVAEEVGPAMMFGKEFTLAMGKGTSDQLRHLVQANARLSYFQMSGMVQMLSRELARQKGDAEGDRSMSFEETLIANMLNDERGGVALLEKLDMPPTYLAFKTSDESREALNQQIAGFLSMMGEAPFVMPAEVEQAGSTFQGYQIAGAKLSKMLSEERREMEEVMGPAITSRFLKAIGEKNLFLLSGIHGEYVMIFIGSSTADLKLVKDPGQSLAGGNALAFCDEYASKDLLAIFYGQSEGLKSVMKEARGSFADMSAGIRDGLANSDQFGDTRNLDALLRVVEEREAALQALSTVHGGGTIAYFEDGLKIESYGGYDSGYNHWQAKNQLAALGQDPNVMLFANVTSNAAYDAKLRGYVEALMETVYAGAMKVAELPIEENDMEEFRNYMMLFDAKFRADLLTFWDGFSNGFDGSLGQERALVLDLQGAMPAFPGLPQGVVDSAKFPRMTWIAPVVDRSKLTDSWKKMNGSMTKIAATISEMVDKDIPMQKPLSSDKDGSTTWFFPLPFFNDDFLPSVTVNDKWFAASSSKLQAVDLIAKAEAGGATSQGFVMHADFSKLTEYASEMAGVMGENAEDLGISKQDLEMAGTIIEGFSEIDSMKLHVRRDDGQLRSSLHFKVAE